MYKAYIMEYINNKIRRFKISIFIISTYMFIRYTRFFFLIPRFKREKGCKRKRKTIFKDERYIENILKF